MTILAKLAGELVTLDGRALDPVSREALQIHVADTVCATLVGSGTPDGRSILRFRTGDERRKIAALGGSALDDIAMRCAITRLSEIDDIHLPSGTTPGSIVVPTAITLSAHLGIKDVVHFANSILAGYEAMTRLGAAVDGQSLVYKGIWTTYFAAPFGTAAVAARLLGLDAERTANALAIALTSISGRMGQPGTGKTSRWLMAGYAARAGCFAAVAAADGFDGDLSLLDGPWLESAQGVTANRDAYLRDAGASVVPEISIKPYCSAKQVIGAIAGFEEILSLGIAPDAIDRVVVSVPRNYAKMIDHGVTLGNRLSSLTSAQHQLALAAYHHESLYDVAREEFVLTPPIDALMRKVSVEVDDGLAAHLPARWPARVEIIAGDRTETATVIDAPGDPNSPFGRETLRQKFHGFADRAIGPAAADIWISISMSSIESPNALADLQSRYLAVGNDG